MCCYHLDVSVGARKMEFGDDPTSLLHRNHDINCQRADGSNTVLAVILERSKDQQSWAGFTRRVVYPRYRVSYRLFCSDRRSFHRTLCHFF